jgi:hypothetical protein
MNEGDSEKKKNRGRREFYEMMIDMSSAASQKENENAVINWIDAKCCCQELNARTLQQTGG